MMVLISRLQGHLWYLFIQPALAGKDLNFFATNQRPHIQK